MNSNSERATGLAFLPVVTTFGFYVLPLNWQSNVLIQFIPQICAYLALGIWGFLNVDRLVKLGLETHKIALGINWGTVTGIILGGVNSIVILYLIPTFGGNIEFLRDTPHAQVPFLVMVPWFILCIACAVELNFRGFLLGRLVVFCSRIGDQRYLSSPCLPRFGILLSVILSALTFSFDPFMVATFGYLHWIAVWDGLIWGWLWVRLTNLYAVIIAHAVEVLIMYLAIRAALS